MLKEVILKANLKVSQETDPKIPNLIKKKGKKVIMHIIWVKLTNLKSFIINQAMQDKVRFYLYYISFYLTF